MCGDGTAGSPSSPAIPMTGKITSHAATLPARLMPRTDRTDDASKPYRPPRWLLVMKVRYMATIKIMMANERATRDGSEQYPHPPTRIQSLRRESAQEWSNRPNDQLNGQFPFNVSPPGQC
ncbi:hypothetical protein GCM10009555_087710 [Acrocarpospora macrocephala]|uniref:Uncharacterized protein n=1 Tax=Acrocarpospora macrocephala TaxID=150177 RepID=A0A5M3WJJ2_9ACTN|nr:hypothetical protein Amac_023920 [Acrocarpospora macrocephala]